MFRRIVCLLACVLLFACGGAAGAETAADYSAEFEAYEFEAPEFEPVLMTGYATGDGRFDLAVYMTGMDESNIYFRLENKGTEPAYFSFSQYMLDGYAVYDYHEWKMPKETVTEEKISIRWDMLRWAGLEKICGVTLSTPGFSDGEDYLYSADTAAVCIGEEAEAAQRPAGMEILSGSWGKLSLAGIDYRGAYPTLVYRLDNEQPSWTLEWARGVTFYSYLGAYVEHVSVNGTAAKGAADLFRNWEGASLDTAYLETEGEPVGEIEELTLNIHLRGGGEDEDFDEQLEITVNIDPEQLLIIREP